MRQSESHEISVVTATMAFFDETALAARGADSQWFAFPKKVLAEIRKGRLVTLDLPMDGEYSVRFTKRGLRPAEEAVATEVATTWVDVPSGRLECADLCGVPSPEAARLGEAGRATLKLDPGRYVLRIWALPLDDDLQDQPHLVIEVSVLEPGVRAPRRPVSPITPWETKPTRRRRDRAPRPRAVGKEREPPKALLSGRLDILDCVALFDPGDAARFRGRPTDWLGDEDAVQEAMSLGDLVLIRSHGEGLSFAELVVAVGPVPGPVLRQAKRQRGGRLVVRSGQIAVGGVDRVPGPSQRRRPQSTWTAAIPPGDYRVGIAAVASHRAKKTGEFFMGLEPWRAQLSVDLPPNVFSRRS